VEHSTGGFGSNTYIYEADSGISSNMAFGDPIQWVIIGVIVVVIFLWGPQKIPDLAKALGRAKKEFDQASKEMSDAVSGSTQVQPAGSAVAAAAPAQKTGDQILIETARALGIHTEGLTREQISAEIVSRTHPPVAQ
jgi:sec-independent protein translocase protein TatA